MELDQRSWPSGCWRRPKESKSRTGRPERVSQPVDQERVGDRCMRRWPSTLWRARPGWAWQGNSR